jgi:hypothetical protein
MKVLCYQEVVRPHRCSCPMSGHCKGVCIPDTMVCALVRGFPREVRRGWQSQKPLIFMHFHEVFLGSQHEIWSKQHNGKVRAYLSHELVSCRVQHWRRNTRFVLERSLKGSAMRYPTTHTISRLLTTKGTYGRSPRGTLVSTKKSCSFFEPGDPNG